MHTVHKACTSPFPVRTAQQRVLSTHDELCRIAHRLMGHASARTSSTSLAPGSKSRQRRHLGQLRWHLCLLCQGFAYRPWRRLWLLAGTSPARTRSFAATVRRPNTPSQARRPTGREPIVITKGPCQRQSRGPWTGGPRGVPWPAGGGRHSQAWRVRCQQTLWLVRVVNRLKLQ